MTYAGQRLRHYTKILFIEYDYNNSHQDNNNNYYLLLFIKYKQA